MTNHLATETSPYLLHHADNPVNWYPWGSEALNLAQDEDKPILLSIGYSACHWCHVMAHECFENHDIASLMNQHFINIKVDREERPDLDSIYMEAVQAITGSGGWPLTVFLTPKGAPFFGGTYFPPEDRRGMPGFSKVLAAVAEAYRNRRGDIEQHAREIITALSRGEITNDVIVEPLTVDLMSNTFTVLRSNFDFENGGFGGAPKFPQSQALQFLLRYASRFSDNKALDMVEFTLEKMARGGIYDQIGGGFHRYTTDQYWMIPHFEKMLYDNALLSRLYLHTYIYTKKSLYRTITEQTLDYILREMTSPEGGFYGSQDADSEGIEGKYYIWTEKEFIDVLGKDIGKMVSNYFGVTKDGNFEGSTVLYVADQTVMETSTIEQAKALLLERRAHRVKPYRDEKILASWNGLIMTSMAEAACVFKREDYLNAAIANGTFLIDFMIVDGHLKHSYKDGQSKIEGYLQDYAMVIDGLLALHQATLQGRWLLKAIELGETMVARFWDKDMLYDSDNEQNNLLFRPRNVFDEAIPSGSSAAANVLLKLAKITGEEKFRQVAIQSLQSVAELMHRAPLGLSNWLCVLDFYLSHPKEIVIVGYVQDAATVELLHTVCTMWLPNKVVVGYDQFKKDPVSRLKLFEGKGMINGKTTVYICENYACKKPATDASSLRAQLS
jgi:uncharacterized protein YyaL (SSP411 family)